MPLKILRKERNMATYTDVTQPVIVSVTKISNFSVDTHLRRMAIVSEGNSTITAGGYQSLTSSNSSTYVRTGTETEVQVSNFFSNAGNSKELILVEVGNGDLESKCAHLKNFIEAEEIKCFCFILPKSFGKVATASRTATASLNTAQTITATATENVLSALSLMNFSQSYYPIGVTFSTDGQVEYNAYTGIYKLADGFATANFPVTATLTDTTAGKEIGKVIFNVAGQTDAEKQTAVISYTNTYTALDTSFVKLATTYNDINNEFLFFVPSAKDEDVALNNYFDGLKSVMLVKENTTLEDTQSVTAAVVGVCASNYFDISTSMPGSSLNYKKCNITPYNYQRAMKQNLINKPCTFVDTLAGSNVILNARMMDGKPWEYYFFWYWVNYNVTNKITSVILNGQNNPVSAVRFDQNGIDTLHANIKSVLNDMVSKGVLTTFAQSYDQSTGSFTSEGDIVMPSYYTFIAENPKDYENEILSGISCYLQIGKFVRQVQWNVTLGY